MRFLGLLLLGLSLPALASRNITTQIHDIDHGLPGEDVLVYLTSGDVVKTTVARASLLQEFQFAKNLNSWVSVTVDEERNILDIAPAAPALQAPVEKHVLAPDLDYVATTVESMARATQYIRSARQSPNPDSQCFNRAMVWTYEWWKNNSLRSNKILIFWSKDYVRRHGFKWWFHIAPYVHVMDEGRVVERVLDVKYISRPVDFMWWANYHSKVNFPCKVVTRYSDYANYPYGHDCYFFRTNMYTYQPADLEMNEAWGYTKTAFRLDEVRAAYLEAFYINY